MREQHAEKKREEEMERGKGEIKREARARK